MYKWKAQIRVFYKITFTSTSVTLGLVPAASVNAATPSMPKQWCNSLWDKCAAHTCVRPMILRPCDCYVGSVAHLDPKQRVELQAQPERQNRNKEEFKEFKSANSLKEGRKIEFHDVHWTFWTFICDFLQILAVIQSSHLSELLQDAAHIAAIWGSKSQRKVPHQGTCQSFCQRCIMTRGRTSKQPFSHIWLLDEFYAESSKRESGALIQLQGEGGRGKKKKNHFHGDSFKNVKKLL